MRPKIDFNAIIARQQHLYHLKPECLFCHHEQVQLIDKNIPAKWKCRICKCQFTHEP
jgi:transposase-like protein